MFLNKQTARLACLANVEKPYRGPRISLHRWSGPGDLFQILDALLLAGRKSFACVFSSPIEHAAASDVRQTRVMVLDKRRTQVLEIHPDPSPSMLTNRILKLPFKMWLARIIQYAGGPSLLRLYS